MCSAVAGSDCHLPARGVFSHACWLDGHNAEISALYEETFRFAAEGHLTVTITARTQDDEKFVGTLDEVRQAMDEREIYNVTVHDTDSYIWPDECNNDPKAGR